MNFADRIVPHDYLPSDWDQAWAKAWFRMGQALFTTHFLSVRRTVYSAVWLRVGLINPIDDHRHLVLKRRNRGFRWEVRPCIPAELSPTHEALYQRYRESLPFEPAPTLRHLLLGEESTNHFPTYQMDLYDGDTLIASGIFDQGKQALSGIACYYDPAYRRYSLGRYLMGLKLEYGQERGMEWFYPGYASPGQHRFDYKWDLGAAALEYFDLAEGTWRRREPGEPVPDPLADMVTRLTRVAAGTAGSPFAPVLRYYLPVDINLNPQIPDQGLFDFPVFLDCFPEIPGFPRWVVVFDPRTGHYLLLQVQTVYRIDGAVDEGSIYGSNLLAVEIPLFATADPQDLAQRLSRLRVKRILPSQ